MEKLITSYCGELERGDFIAVSNSNYIDLGFYLGRGVNNSTQYYTLNSIIWWKSEDYKGKRKFPFTAYFQNSPHLRIVKMHPDHLVEKYRIMYDQCVEILKELQILQ